MDERPMETMTATELNDLRRKILNDEEYSLEDLEKAVQQLLGERVAAAQSTATASRKRPARKVDLSDLL